VIPFPCAAALALPTGGGRHPVGGQLRTLAEEELLHLFQQELPGLRIGHAEPVMVHQDRGLALADRQAGSGAQLVGVEVALGHREPQPHRPRTRTGTRELHLVDRKAEVVETADPRLDLVPVAELHHRFLVQDVPELAVARRHLVGVLDELVLHRRRRLEPSRDVERDGPTQGRRRMLPPSWSRATISGGRPAARAVS